MTNLVPENEQQYGSILTVLGENAEQNGKLLNKQVEFTHIAFGDANDTYVQPDRKAQALVNELHRIPVNSVDVLQPTPDSVPILKVEAILPDDINDVVIREFAAVATFNGQTYFHAIGNCARVYVPKPLNNGNVSNPVTLEMTFVITSADPIVEIDPNVITASRAWVGDNFSLSARNTKKLYVRDQVDYASIDEVFDNLDSALVRASQISPVTGQKVEIYVEKKSDQISFPEITNITSDVEIIGDTPVGVRPTVEQLELLSEDERESQLRGFYRTEIKVAGGLNVKANLSFKDVLISKESSLGTGSNIKSEYLVKFSGSSLISLGVKAYKAGEIESDDLLLCNPESTGLHVHNGGIIVAPNSQTVGVKNRGVYVQRSGVIDAPNSTLIDTTNDAAFVLFNGTINLQNSKIKTVSGHAAVINYAGTIVLDGSDIDGTTNTTITSESNGAIYCKNANLRNSQKGFFSTSFGGVINAENADVDFCNEYVAYGLGSGFINLKGVNIGEDCTPVNGVRVRAIGEATIYCEEPGTTDNGAGKGNLLDTELSPPWNRVGNGASLISTYTHDVQGIGVGQLVITRDPVKRIEAGRLDIDHSSWVRVDTENGAASGEIQWIDNITKGQEVILQLYIPTRTITLRSGGNIDLESDVVIDRYQPLKVFYDGVSVRIIK